MITKRNNPMDVQGPMTRRWVVCLATGGGLGRSPLMPGTVGALWGLPLAWLLGQLPPWLIQLPVIVALFVVGVPLCSLAARQLGGVKDPGAIVFDEIVSLPVTYFLWDLHRPWVLLAGFVLNRAFDIVKPPPARQLERLHGGLGIMADDVAAGIYANLALHVLEWMGVLGTS